MSERGKFILGTAIRISCVLDSTDVPTSVVITIEDPAGTDKVSDASMILEATGVYYYIWQTEDSASYDSGVHDALIKVTSDGYTSIACQTFELVDVMD